MSSDQVPEDKPKFSVLIMGKTQSGKSTLVQFVKNYVDRQYPINTELIGKGNVALTTEPKRFFVTSNLPEYEVVEKKKEAALDLSNLVNVGTYDDYQESISYREGDYELREMQRQQDADDSPFESVELMFLDTPGINDTNNDDSVHAETIIKEVITTRSFNLVLFVFKYDNPLTLEQQIPLKYYAEVLKEFRSSMAFLFTHVKYEDCHHSNSRHRKMIDTRLRALSRLLQGRDMGHCSSETITPAKDKDYVGNLPCFTIDFTEKRRPVQQWMIRDTLRNILRFAVANPPSLMDTSKANIDRITNVIHPTKMNDEQRKKTRARESDAKQHEEPVVMIQPTTESENMAEQINILLLGDVQSGKTSLVETMRLYADPNYVVKHNLINHGILHSAEKRVKITSFLSELPTIEIRMSRSNNCGFHVVDLDKESETKIEEDFDDLLNRQKDINTHIVRPRPPKQYRFNIYEGPSLNESDNNFEKNVFNIHKTIVKSKAKFHLVLFTLAPGAITAAIKSTVRVCTDVFSDLSSLFSFVHTKIDYSRLHSGNKKFKEFVRERQDILWQQIHEQQSNKYHINHVGPNDPDPKLIKQQATQRSSAPYLIDCDFQTKWPVRRGKTQNVIRDILSAAVNQAEPAAIDQSMMKKTPKMIAIDTGLKWKIKDEYEESKKTITSCNTRQTELLDDMVELDAGIARIVKGRTPGMTSVQEGSAHDLEVVHDEKHQLKEEIDVRISSLTMEFDRRGSLDNIDSREGESEELAALRQKRSELERQWVEVEETMADLWKVQERYFRLRDWISRVSLPAAVMEALTAATEYNVNETSDTPLETTKKIYLGAQGVYSADCCPVKDKKAEDFEDYLSDRSDGDYSDDSEDEEEIEEIDEMQMEKED
ncbi:hypothetical protein BGZ81_001649 [Podila clonocystis]|nr:hypothetical protein BGZ81_001649 [Podila clonocystis]